MVRSSNHIFNGFVHLTGFEVFGGGKVIRQSVLSGGLFESVEPLEPFLGRNVFVHYTPTSGTWLNSWNDYLPSDLTMRPPRRYRQTRPLAGGFERNRQSSDYDSRSLNTK